LILGIFFNSNKMVEGINWKIRVDPIQGKSVVIKRGKSKNVLTKGFRKCSRH
jgi:hypothetical protein